MQDSQPSSELQELHVGKRLTSLPVNEGGGRAGGGICSDVSIPTPNSFSSLQPRRRRFRIVEPLFLEAGCRRECC